MAGPYQPENGYRFDKSKPLLDPYAKAVTGNFTWDLSHSFGPATPASELPSLAGMPKCIALHDNFDWQGDRPLNRPLQETIIYETHVRSLTCHPSAKVEHPGTFRGVIEKIPYFKDLGVTAIELLPVHQFYRWEFTRHHPKTGQRLPNYWGYNSLCFFAPHAAYSHLGSERGQQVTSFKEMVQALHAAGIEIIIDIVLNHTMENDHQGRTLSFRGIDNSIYYMLEDDKRYYKNFSGVGNTLNCNQPIMRDFVIDCLRYWVREMHVDGFRFDLATILSRDRWGNISGNPALPARIAEDPLLRNSKIIAEPWDIGGYQVGDYPGGRWVEWNDKYRDELRSYWRGDPGLTHLLATRLAGSADLYHKNGRQPNHSVNFVASHDGFTLNDVVSYNQKHNEDNGEGNGDGHDHNISYNFEHEGPSDDPLIEEKRSRQVKNFLATMLLSQGTPMLHGGDEFRRTQQGNNNAYCQDNEISWYNWNLLQEHADVFRFTRLLISLRQAHPVFRRTTFFTGLDSDGNLFRDIHWYDANGKDATWDPTDKILMCSMDGSKAETGASEDDVDVLMLFNVRIKPCHFQLVASAHGGHWQLVIDTGQPSPHDIYEEADAVEVKSSIYRLQPRSMAVMFARWEDTTA